MATKETLHQILEELYPKPKGNNNIIAPYGRAIRISTATQIFDNVFFLWEKQNLQALQNNEWTFTIFGKDFLLEGNDINQIEQL
jgi:hypothetical protein